jgi:hypothetical protein
MSPTIDVLLVFLRDNPALLIFAALSGGYALGKLKFGTFSFGSTTSVLLVAIALGALILGNTQYDLGLIKFISFGFFIFAIGYRVGPDFVGGLKRGGIKYIIISVFFCVVALFTAIALAKLFGLNKGLYLRYRRSYYPPENSPQTLENKPARIRKKSRSRAWFNRHGRYRRSLSLVESCHSKSLPGGKPEHHWENCR